MAQLPLSVTPRAIGLVLLAAVISVPAAAAEDEQTIGDIREEREKARDEEAAALEELEFLEIEDQRMAEIMADIQALVDSQIARVQSARQQLDAAEAEVLDRERRAATATVELQATTDAIRTRAVDAFIGTNRQAEPWLNSSDLNRTAIRLAMLDFAAGSDRDQLDLLRRLRSEREVHLEAGREARNLADELRRAVEDELAELEQRRAVQAEIQGELRTRIEEWEREAARRAREAQELTELIRQKQTEALGFTPGEPGAESVEGFIMPIAGSVGSGFGLRVHPIFGSTRMHTGVDVGADTGDPIWAAKAGRVIFAGRKGGYGNTVIVQHEGNVATLYAHLNEVLVSDGDWVEQGEFVGLTGSTGWSTGPHLHFEVRVNGDPRDPLLFLPL